MERKKLRISPNGISIRLVETSDAKFILELRTNQKLSQYISWTSLNMEDQIQWNIDYQRREANNYDFHLIHEVDSQESWGLIREYHCSVNSFTIGSWVCYPGNPEHIAVNAWLLAVEFGFESLRFNSCQLDVRKRNRYVLYYLKLFEPVLIKEDELDFYFSFTK